MTSTDSGQIPAARKAERQFSNVTVESYASKAASTVAVLRASVADNRGVAHLSTTELPNRFLDACLIAKHVI